MADQVKPQSDNPQPDVAAAIPAGDQAKPTPAPDVPADNGDADAGQLDPAPAPAPTLDDLKPSDDEFKALTTEDQDAVLSAGDNPEKGSEGWDVLQSFRERIDKAKSKIKDAADGAKGDKPKATPSDAPAPGDATVLKDGVPQDGKDGKKFAGRYDTAEQLEAAHVSLRSEFDKKTNNEREIERLRLENARLNGQLGQGQQTADGVPPEQQTLQQQQDGDPEPDLNPYDETSKRDHQEWRARERARERAEIKRDVLDDMTREARTQTVQQQFAAIQAVFPKVTRESMVPVAAFARDNKLSSLAEAYPRWLESLGVILQPQQIQQKANGTQSNQDAPGPASPAKAGGKSESEAMLEASGLKQSLADAPGGQPQEKNELKVPITEFEKWDDDKQDDFLIKGGVAT